VLKEIERSLESHELIKIRVHDDARDVRERFLVTLCDCLQAAPVQHIGKMLVLWRPRPDQPAGVARPRPRNGLSPGAASAASRGLPATDVSLAAQRTGFPL
jgi:hypothetical protein